MKVFDTDAHVEESEETFASIKNHFGDAAPRVIEGEKRAFWLIEGRSFPRLNGFGVHTFGSPHLKRAAGHVDPERRARVESQELRDPRARLQDMDHEGIDVSVVFPTMFLVWPLAESPALARALCRSYNEWVAAKCAASGGRIRWVATVPLPDVPGSVEEVNRAKKLGACGGNASHFNLELLRLASGASTTRVAFPAGSGAIVTALLGGHIDCSSLTWSAVEGQVKGGKLRVLAATSRIRDLPQVPTFAAAGFPQVNLEVFYGVYAPATVPGEIVGKLSAAFERLLQDPANLDTVRKLGFEPMYQDSGQLGERLKREMQVVRELVKEAGIKARQ